MDEIETRAEQLLCAMFAPGQDYSATIQLVFNAVLRAGDTVLSLSPSQGGHVSHKVLIGRRDLVQFYPLTTAGHIDYDALADLAYKHRPKLIIAGGSACPREIDFARIGEIARAVGSLFHADVSHTATFIVPDPLRRIWVPRSLSIKWPWAHDP